MKGLQINEQIKQQTKRKKWKKEIISWAKTLTVILLLVVVVRSFLFTNYIVYGQSMMPTIHDRDRVIINKIGYDIGSPERFDLVVFHANESTDYIKRVIGLPGDSIEYKNDVLYVNGEAIEETYLDNAREKYVDVLYTDDFTLEQLSGMKFVPENHIFVLGDNRRNSVDSRIIGFVPIEQVVGKADLCYWPLRDFRKL